VADFNGDGHPDLIWQDPANGMSQVWFLGGAQGTTITGSAYLSGANAWRIVGVADLNGDGHPDVIWQDPATGMSQVWFLGGAQGTTITGAAHLSGPNAWRIVAVADLDGDGHPDAIWQDLATGRSEVWFLGGTQGTTLLGAATLSGPNTWRITE
jgi:FG-GAP-like repeat